MSLLESIWTNEIRRDFVEETDFVAYSKDYSSYVNNDTLYLVKAGGIPKVVWNHPDGTPLPKSKRNDTPLAIPMERMDTENQEVSNLEQIQLKYDKLKDVADDMREGLRQDFALRAAQEWAPEQNTAMTPVLPTTGEADASGLKKITFDDLITLRGRFNKMKVPPKGRILLLTTDHEDQLMMEDKDRYHRLFDGKDMVYGFRIFRYGDNPRFNKDTLQKVSFGAADAATDVQASIAWHERKVGRALGRLIAFRSKAADDPVNRENLVGFRQMAKLTQVAQEYLAALVPVSNV